MEFIPKKPDFGIVEPEVLCCIHKLYETRNGKRKLVEEINPELLEARGDDPTKNLFQVSTDSSEYKRAKVRKCDTCRDWHMHELPLHVTIGNRAKRYDGKRLQLGHECNPLELELGGWVGHEKTERDNAHGSRE